MEVALNEADVVGIRMGNAPAVVDVLLHVLALPSEGPIDPDPRRVLQLHGVGELLVLLRHDSAIDGYGPPQPLRDLDAVEEFFASLSRVDAMYGWRFFDEPSLVADWPSDVSLRLDLGGAPGHTFYWFAECWRGEGNHVESFCLEGTSRDQPRALRADRTEQAVDDFVADGHRWWEALRALDPRLSTEAQQEWGDRALRWRGRDDIAVMGTF